MDHHYLPYNVVNSTEQAFEADPVRSISLYMRMTPRQLWRGVSVYARPEHKKGLWSLVSSCGAWEKGSNPFRSVDITGMLILRRMSILCS